MAPKGAVKPLSNVRAQPELHGNGWRISVTLLGAKVRGPTRESAEEAKQDLAVAQRAKGQQEMKDFLNLLRTSCKEDGQSLTADDLWQRLQQSHEQVGGVSAAGSATQGSATQSLTGVQSSAESLAEEAHSIAPDTYDAMAKHDLWKAAIAKGQGEQCRRSDRKGWKTNAEIRQILREHDSRPNAAKPSRERRSAAEKKMSRLQRKRMKFWLPCFFNWSLMRAAGAKRTDSGAPYAPRFHQDGRISIMQKGVVKYLPCPEEPPSSGSTENVDQGGLQPLAELPSDSNRDSDQELSLAASASEVELACYLRCRIGAVNCIRAAEWTTQGFGRPCCAKVKGDAETGCVHNKRLKRFDWQCPLRLHSKRSLESLSGEITSVAFKAPRRLAPPFTYPEVPGNAQQFLCCSQCPLVCCTFDCPWSSSALGPTGVPYCLQPCTCQQESCIQCSHELLMKRQSYEKRLITAGGESEYLCLEDPPPDGYTLYSGVGEPVSDSSRRIRRPSVYILTCRRWKLQEGVAIGSQRRDEAFVLDLLEQAYPHCELATTETLKIYSPPCCIWTADEAVTWSQSFANSPSSGYEFAWQSDAEGWLQDRFQIDGEWDVAERSLTAGSPNFCQTLRIVDGTTASIKCKFCRFLNGECSAPPEDIAIQVAEALAWFLHAVGKPTAITPNGVLHFASRWRRIASKLSMLSEETCLVGDALGELVDGMSWKEFCADILPGVPYETEVHAVHDLLEELQAIREDLERRVTAARITGPHNFEDWQPASESRLQQLRGTSGKPFSGSLLEKVWKHRLQKVGVAKVPSAADLNAELSRSMLRQNKFCSPIFALVGKLGPDPSWSFKQARDCMCAVPWHERSLWERHPHVKYQLPPPTSLWQSVWHDEEQCTAWVLRELPQVSEKKESLHGATPLANTGVAQGTVAVQRATEGVEQRPMLQHEPTAPGSASSSEHGEAQGTSLRDQAAQPALTGCCGNVAAARGEESQHAPASGSASAAPDKDPAILAPRQGGSSTHRASHVEDLPVDIDTISWSSGEEERLMKDITEEQEEAGSQELQETASESSDGEVQEKNLDEDMSSNEVRRAEIKEELAILLDGCATPPRRQQRDDIDNWSEKKQPLPDNVRCEGPSSSNGGKVVGLLQESAPASGSAASAVTEGGSDQTEPHVAQVVENALMAKLRCKGQASIAQIGANHDVQQVIRQVEQVRWVTRQRQLGRYRHLGDEPPGDVPRNGYPDYFYPGLHRLPLPGLSSSLCYSYSAGHVGECLALRGHPSDSGSSDSSSSESFWDAEGDFGRVSELVDELHDLSDGCSDASELDVDPCELDG